MTAAAVLVEPYTDWVEATGLRAVIYARISEDRWGEGEGCERQIEDGYALAERRGLRVVKVFRDDDVSAMKGKRPGYDDMLAWIRDGRADVIIVLRVDRLYRKLADLVELTKALGNTPVYSVKSGDIDLSTADGRLHANILGSVAQHESEVKAERIARTLSQRLKRGRFIGGPRRFGYEHSDTRVVYIHRGEDIERVERPTGPLRLVPDEADAIDWGYKHILAGGKLNQVMREWRSRGLVGPTGKAPSASMVRDVLLRPMNAGIVMIKGEVIDIETSSEIPVITDAESWYGVRAILTNPARKTTPDQHVASLLASVLRCSVCLEHPELATRNSARMWLATRHRSDGTRVKAYKCREGHVSRDWVNLDTGITELLLRYLIANAARLRRPVVASDSLSSAVHEGEALRDQLNAYAEMAADMHPEDYKRATVKIRTRLAQVEERILTVAGQPATLTLINTPNILRTWMGMTIEDRRTVLKENVDHIVIARGSSARGKTMQGVRVVRTSGEVMS